MYLILLLLLLLLSVVVIFSVISALYTNKVIKYYNLLLTTNWDDFSHCSGMGLNISGKWGWDGLIM